MALLWCLPAVTLIVGVAVSFRRITALDAEVTGTRTALIHLQALGDEVSALVAAVGHAEARRSETTRSLIYPEAAARADRGPDGTNR